ncbi:hypothetical protein CGW93_02995 [candidate division bacterium WOR-3 4484_18]|uniref:DJ-1/PfpI domain-containing protein n=1 Tax=candidate division WOR-3 bacterium 4484_18 TaxID=2020626 RepID=A0A257LTL1_UNCW3|nr:MAG: hypothetical protein CGW93_02995 [candidate division bacterium WOR-3 4484_18]
MLLMIFLLTAVEFHPKVLMLVAPNGFRDEEYTIPRRILEDNGAYITVASTCKGELKGMLGLKIQADTVIYQVNPLDFDAIVLVGGVGSTIYWEDDSVHSMIKKANDSLKVVAAICLAPATLANAGVLTNKKATVFPTSTSLQIFEANNVRYVKDGVVITDRIVTASGPQFAEKFGESIWQLLKKYAGSTTKSE